MAIYNDTGINSEQSLESRYNNKAQERELYLERARDCSELTIPTLIPQDGYTGAEDFETTYQGIGARGVNNLASKLLLSLLPPNAPFFRLAIDNFAVRELEEDVQLLHALPLYQLLLELELVHRVSSVSLKPK